MSPQHDWRQIWQRLDQQRVSIGMSWRAVLREAGVSQRTLIKMRDDGVALQSPAKRSSLARALHWSPDSIDRLLAGAPPVAAVPATPPLLRGDDRTARLEGLVADLAEQVAWLTEQFRAALAAVNEPTEPPVQRQQADTRQSPGGAS